MIFLDTNVLSETMRVRPDPAVMSWLAKKGNRTVISTVVLAELSFGIEKIRPAERAKRLDVAVAGIRVGYAKKLYGFDEESALIYAKIMGSAVRRGAPRPILDGMIAAITLRHAAILATRNTTDFEPLGVRVTNPWDPNER